jgi:hypothetical protein
MLDLPRPKSRRDLYVRATSQICRHKRVEFVRQCISKAVERSCVGGVGGSAVSGRLGVMGRGHQRVDRQWVGVVGGQGAEQAYC